MSMLFEYPQIQADFVSTTLKANLVRFDGRDDVPDVVKFINDALSLAAVNSSAADAVKKLALTRKRGLYAQLQGASTMRGRRIQMQINIINELARRVEK